MNRSLIALQQMMELAEQRLSILFVATQKTAGVYLLLIRRVEPVLALLIGAMALTIANVVDALNLGMGNKLDVLNADVINLMDTIHANVMQLATVAVVPIYRVEALGNSLVKEVLRLQTAVLKFLHHGTLLLRPSATAMQRHREVQRASSQPVEKIAHPNEQKYQRGKGKLTPLQIAFIVLVLDLLLRYPSNKLWDFIWDKFFP